MTRDALSFAMGWVLGVSATWGLRSELLGHHGSALLTVLGGSGAAVVLHVLFWPGRR